MRTFFIVVAVLAVVVLIVVFRKQIGAFFSPDEKPADGTACTDVNGNASTYKDGKCIETAVDGTPCILNGRAGVMENGTCIPSENAQRIIYPQTVPSRITVRRYTMNCLTRIRVPQYPGIIWNLIGSNRFFCYYSR